MPQVLDEQREPGVYVRSNRPDQELDFLWDKERKKTPESDRFHLSFFMGGVVVGSLITLAGCLFFFSSGRFTSPGTTAKPPIIEEQVLPENSAQPEAVQPDKQKPKQNKSTGIQIPFFSAKQPKPEQKPPVTTEVKARLYEVQPGDTLGSIALKFYDSSNPEYVARIQRANQLSSADSLSIGQQLSIPPKSY